MFLRRSSVVTTEIRSSSSVEVLALVDLHKFKVFFNNMSEVDCSALREGQLSQSLMMEVFDVEQYYLEFILFLS